MVSAGRRQQPSGGWSWARGALLGATVFAVIALLEAVGLTDLGFGVGATFAVVFALVYTAVRMWRERSSR